MHNKFKFNIIITYTFKLNLFNQNEVNFVSLQGAFTNETKTCAMYKEMGYVPNAT